MFADFPGGGGRPPTLTSACGRPCLQSTLHRIKDCENVCVSTLNIILHCYYYLFVTYKPDNYLVGNIIT